MILRQMFPDKLQLSKEKSKDLRKGGTAEQDFAQLSGFFSFLSC